MNPINIWRVERQATRDAHNGFEANIDHLGPAILGPRPRAPGAIEDATLLEHEGADVRLEALADEIEALARQRFELRPRALYAVGALLAFAVEAGAAFAVLGLSLGFEPRERLYLGLSLAACTAIVATGVAAAERMTRTAFGTWALRVSAGLVFLALVASLAWLRATTGEEDVSPVALIAAIVVLLGATATPAIVVHQSVTGFERTHSLVQRQRRATRERARLERNRTRSRDKQVAAERAASQWDADLAQLRSLYLSRHRATTAEIVAARAERERRNASRRSR